MVQKIRYGVIGCGSMGREHIENIKALDAAEVTAISDTHPASRIATRTMRIRDRSDHRAAECTDVLDVLAAHAAAADDAVANGVHRH